MINYHKIRTNKYFDIIVFAIEFSIRIIYLIYYW